MFFTILAEVFVEFNQILRMINLLASTDNKNHSSIAKKRNNDGNYNNKQRRHLKG